MRNHKLFYASASAMAFMAVSFAGAAYAQTEPSTVDQLQATNERVLLLEARVKELELQKKVQGINAELSGGGRVGSSVSTLDYGTPTVQSVEGRKGHLEAVLQYQGGVRQRVREGDSVFGSKVTLISLNEVVLYNASSKRADRLQFATGTSAIREAGAPGVQAGMSGQMGGMQAPNTIPMPR